MQLTFSYLWLVGNGGMGTIISPLLPFFHSLLTKGRFWEGRGSPRPCIETNAHMVALIGFSETLVAKGCEIGNPNPEPLNPKPLNPKPLNPKPLNPKPLNPEVCGFSTLGCSRWAESATRPLRTVAILMSLIVIVPLLSLDP